MTSTHARHRAHGMALVVLLMAALLLSIMPPTASAAPHTREVTGSTVNVRTAPGGKIVGTMKRGARVTATDTVKSGYRLLTNGRWMAEQYLKPVTAQVVTSPTPASSSQVREVTGSTVNVRTAPGGKIVGVLKRGTKVATTSTVKSGFRLLANGRWMADTYLMLVTQAPAPAPAKPEPWTVCPKIGLGGVNFSAGAITADMDRVVTVLGDRSSYATVTLWGRTSGKSCEFTKIRSEGGRVGANGIVADSERKQDTNTTPAGIYTMSQGFSNGSAPATKLAWRVTRSSHYWVQDNNSDLYNTYATSASGFRTSEAERLQDYGAQYRYSIVIDFNTAKTRGKGAGIFLHVSGKGATAGCVSVSESFVMQIANSIEPGDLIAISR